MSQRRPGHGGRIPRCPICGKPRVQAFRPFCSARCRDVDLARWFDQTYAIPVVEPGLETGAEADEDEA
ncbi:MAG: DNA gyrase inhibitor YacG [Geminicoccaceae bacterium]